MQQATHPTLFTHGLIGGANHTTPTSGVIYSTCIPQRHPSSGVASAVGLSLQAGHRIKSITHPQCMHACFTAKTPSSGLSQHKGITGHAAAAVLSHHHTTMGLGSPITCHVTCFLRRGIVTSHVAGTRHAWHSAQLARCLMLCKLGRGFGPYPHSHPPPPSSS